LRDLIVPPLTLFSSTLIVHCFPLQAWTAWLLGFHRAFGPNPFSPFLRLRPFPPLVAFVKGTFPLPTVSDFSGCSIFFPLARVARDLILNSLPDRPRFLPFCCRPSLARCLSSESILIVGVTGSSDRQVRLRLFQDYYLGRIATVADISFNSNRLLALLEASMTSPPKNAYVIKLLIYASHLPSRKCRFRGISHSPHLLSTVFGSFFYVLPRCCFFDARRPYELSSKFFFLSTSGPPFSRLPWALNFRFLCFLGRTVLPFRLLWFCPSLDMRVFFTPVPATGLRFFERPFPTLDAISLSCRDSLFWTIVRISSSRLPVPWLLLSQAIMVLRVVSFPNPPPSPLFFAFRSAYRVPPRSQPFS